ncbi:hypothetical protein KSP40_PGU012799 [Platanthera guangdongensis]|uniref:Uncharacterized protein n=1 Tax=Platanthera guangdongensis TaxID=2320717 RepID=A0ABR2M702_9ASPA
MSNTNQNPHEAPTEHHTSTTNSNLPTGTILRRGRPRTYASTPQRREAANARRRELRRNQQNIDASTSEATEDGRVRNYRRGRPPMYASTQERREAFNFRRRVSRRIQQNDAASIQQMENVVPILTQQHPLDHNETGASQPGLERWPVGDQEVPEQHGGGPPILPHSSRSCSISAKDDLIKPSVALSSSSSAMSAKSLFLQCLQGILPPIRERRLPPNPLIPIFFLQMQSRIFRFSYWLTAPLPPYHLLPVRYKNVKEVTINQRGRWSLEDALSGECRCGFRKVGESASTKGARWKETPTC